ncbi:MAG: DUF2156 domain-containing protein [Verrucomicrobiae bacterium]|nr:DUF2156 domain-containing protein [Verrucomicrobiae bacterium]
MTPAAPAARPPEGEFFDDIARLEPAALRCLEGLAYEHGRYFDSYLATEPGRGCFFSPQRHGAISFARLGRYVKVIGGLLCPPGHRDELLDQFMAQIRARGLHVAFYNIDDSETHLFRQRGFAVAPWCADAAIPLTGPLWSGGSFEWVRRQIHYCNRHGVEFVELTRGAFPPDRRRALLLEALALDRALLATKPQRRPMRTLTGTFDPHNLHRRRIFLALADRGSGRLEGFVACNPGRAGAFWAIEIYRHRPDAVRGVVPFLIAKALLRLQADGAKAASLCPVPGYGLDRFPTRFPWLNRRAIDLFSVLLDVRGLYHFKSRFRPEFVPLSYCVYPRMTLGSALAFLRLWGLTDISITRTCRIVLARCFRRERRAHLADFESHRHS